MNKRKLNYFFYALLVNKYISYLNFNARTWLEEKVYFQRNTDVYTNIATFAAINIEITLYMYIHIRLRSENAE